MQALRELKSSAHSVLIRLGIDIRRPRPDRVMLEKTIFPYLLRRTDYKRILFVGCAWYTQHYPWIFRDRDFTTLELCGDEARFGTERHIVDSCEHVERHFESESLDVIVFNGVFGCGLNEREACERTLNGFARVLREDGLLIFGWNDLPQMKPFPPGELAALKKFRPESLPPIGATKVQSSHKNKHVFQFFVKDGPLGD